MNVQLNLMESLEKTFRSILSTGDLWFFEPGSVPLENVLKNYFGTMTSVILVSRRKLN